MIMPWVLFFICTTIAYIGIALFAQLTGGSSTTAWGAFFSTLKPLPLFVTTVANMIFGLALFYGFSLTRFAIPVAIAIGAVTSFVYSVVILGSAVSALKIVGIVLVVVGVVFLGL